MALPAPTKLTPTDRYIQAGHRVFTWVPDIEDQAAPTLAELSAGTDLSKEAFEVSGFTATSQSVEVPDFGSTFTGKIPGMKTAEDSSFRLYLSLDATDARELLAEDTDGFVVIYPEGIVTGGKLDVYRVRIGSSNIDQGAPGDVASMTTMVYQMEPPHYNIDIPSS